VDGSGLAESCVLDVQENFGPLGVKFKTNYAIASDRVVRLEDERADLEEQVLQLRLSIADKLEMSKEMKVIKGLQGNLKTALEIVSEFDNGNFPFGEQKEHSEDKENSFEDGVMNQSY